VLTLFRRCFNPAVTLFNRVLTLFQRCFDADVTLFRDLNLNLNLKADAKRTTGATAAWKNTADVSVPVVLFQRNGILTAF